MGWSAWRILRTFDGLGLKVSDLGLGLFRLFAAAVRTSLRALAPLLENFAGIWIL